MEKLKYDGRGRSHPGTARRGNGPATYRPGDGNRDQNGGTSPLGGAGSLLHVDRPPRAAADWIASASRGGPLGGRALSDMGTHEPASGAVRVRPRVVTRKAYDRDDRATLHAADRICRGMVSSDSRNPHWNSALHG